MESQDIKTGTYSTIISKKVIKIEAKSKLRTIRRLFFLGIILLVCFGGIFMGIISKYKYLDIQYQKYIENPNQSALNDELLSYKDIYKLFEASFLGNHPYQSLMGGFFYEGIDYSIRPDNEGRNMVVRSGDKQVILCEGLASDINVKDGFVYYRRLNSRSITSFNITTGKVTDMPLNNVGQFIICGDKLFYIDLSTSSLVLFNMTTHESEKIIQSDVSSFVIAGNNIIYLGNDKVLYEINLSDYSKTIVKENITEFTYNGKLWFQNNIKVYTKALNKKNVKECGLGGIQCNHLFGITETQIFFESEDGIYVYNIKTNTSRKIVESIFVGASDETLLIYNTSTSNYQVIDLY